MYEQEKQRVIHLIILLCCTIFIIVLTGEAVLLGWELGAVVLLLLGLAVCWVLHMTERIPDSIRLWLYFILTMLAFFFYGIHETSIYELAPVMIFLIFMCSTTDMHMLVTLCIVTYYLTMCYDFVFVAGGSVEYTTPSIMKTLLHLVLVYMAGRLAKLVMKRRSNERKNTDNRIAELKEINRRTEDFLTNVSHELRTPINVVTGITAVMLKNEEDTDKRKDIFSIQMAGYRLFSQIEDILDYTEIDTGRIRVSEDTYMISSLINDIIGEKHLWERENIPEMVFDIDAGIPSVLLGDGRKIKKIIRHLTDNAVKFTKRGGVYVRVYALHKTYGVNLCIRVSDTGIGIDEENIEKITEKFFQSNGGRNRSAGGLGLGLPIVYGMVAAMEGFIQIESVRGSGTTVYVSIPQKVSDESPCMEVPDRADLCVACFLKPEKYEVPEVRNYYNEAISHMVQGLNMPLHRVSDIEELKGLTKRYQLTHLVIGREEYEENTSCFEYLDENIEVIVMADDSFVLPRGSRIKLLRKPFYCLPIVNILNAGVSEASRTFEKKRMICPNVRVLVVDDEPMNLLVAEGIFKDYQMKVKTAGSGIEAIELCGKEEFDLIFLDHMMPEMDGVETLKRLRQLPKDTGRVFTVIAFTANAVSGAREMFLHEGFDEFVSKPIEDLDLERVLRKVLPKSSIAFVDENNIKNKNTVEYKTGEKRSMEGQIPKKHSKEDKMECLESAGVNTRSGMQYSRGDWEFYQELLVKFAQDEEKKASEMDDFFHKEDFGNYRILVHALKSSARMVGADFLSEMAKNAEEAAKDSDAGYITEHHGELLDRYHQLTQRILQIFDSGENTLVQTAQGDETEISKGGLVQRLTELKDVLDTFEADKAEALISEMSAFVYQSTSVRELLCDVRQEVDDFEFTAASGKVEALIRNMEGGEAG